MGRLPCCVLVPGWRYVNEKTAETGHGAPGTELQVDIQIYMQTVTVGHELLVDSYKGTCLLWTRRLNFGCMIYN